MNLKMREIPKNKYLSWRWVDNMEFFLCGVFTRFARFTKLFLHLRSELSK